ncbi:MAG: hypothetical protein HUJ76_10825 [Parasporobacterium sp.]|nr:hypothetical protein [Parasporobacterium sp.]
MNTSAKKGLSAAVLKNIAVITMTLDHVTAFILKAYLVSNGMTRYYNNEWYALGRYIGRIAFVLYAFMLAEGAMKTRSKVKYAARLLALAVISIVPHSYVQTGKLFNPDDLNIFFPLFLGLITIYAYQWLKDKLEQPVLSFVGRLALVAASCAVAVLLKFEYGLMGILLMLVCYIFRYDRRKMVLGIFLVNTAGYMLNVVVRSGAVQWFERNSGNIIPALINTDRTQLFGILAIPLILMYNGEKGRQLPKAFYYFYYPVHLGIIALIVNFM